MVATPPRAMVARVAEKMWITVKINCEALSYCLGFLKLPHSLENSR